MLQPDTLLGSYRLLGRIGAGGMGEVWKAEDTRLGRMVAIKILPPHVASDATAIARMKREARTAALLYHPNIATIHAFEEIDDQTFIAMEFVEGEPLSRLIGRRIAEADICRIGRSVADALAEAHGKGIVHRDIKPDNIIVSGSRVKVLDFGIAKRIGVETSNANDPTAFMTQQGFIIGTVQYMSPEQALGREVDARTDIFSLGVVLYEAATGTLPFQGESVTDTITRIVRDEPAAPARLNREISPAFDAIIRRCLRKERDLRFASAADLAKALEAQMVIAPTAPYTMPTPKTLADMPTVPRHAPEPRRNYMWIAVIAGALVIAAFVGALAMKDEPPSRKIVQATTTTAAPAPAPVTAPPVVAAAPSTSGFTVIESPEPPPREKTAADDYEAGLARLAEGDRRHAREAFNDAIEKDPHHARSHFRLGEIMLFVPDFEGARRELNFALDDADRLSVRERKLTELALALLDRNRFRAKELMDELLAANPNDPDVMRLRRQIIERRIAPPPQQAPPVRPFRRRLPPRP